MALQTTEGTSPPTWPTIQEQLAEAKAVPGSALEQLIRDNQDFDLLHREEAHDNLGYPAWLRVYWRKAHPEARSYPSGLHRIHSWVLAHPPEARGICRLFQAARNIRARYLIRRNL